MDRGGDRGYLYQYLLHNRLRFMIRIRATRSLQAGPATASAVELAASCPMLFEETIVREEEGQERLVRLSCGMRKVRLPGRSEDLTLVVVKGFGQEPMMILTNLPVRRSRKSIWDVIASYITRWRIEDVIRFVKQSYRLEDIRCLTYHRLQALMVLVTAAAYFAAVYLGLTMKLRILAGHVLRASKRVFGIPDFRLYALADGIRQYLYNQTRSLHKLLDLYDPSPIQRLLFDS